MTKYGCGITGAEAEVDQRRKGNNSGGVVPGIEIETPYDGERFQRRAAIHTVQERVDVASPRATVDRNLSKACEGA